MVRIEDAAAVARVLRRMDEGICDPAGEFFANTKRTPVRNFELEAHYLSLLNEAKEEITLTMAYFSPLEKFTDAILAAYRRGVRVTVLIPACANLQNDINQSTVRRLLKKSRGGIRVLLSPKMVHTKLVANEARVSLGSTNINKKAFAQLDELNWCIPNDDSAFCRALWASVRENQALSREVRDYREIRYCRWRAFLESFLV
jgi:cardiolipin synthase